MKSKQKIIHDGNRREIILLITIAILLILSITTAAGLGFLTWQQEQQLQTLRQEIEDLESANQRASNELQNLKKLQKRYQERFATTLFATKSNRDKVMNLILSLAKQSGVHIIKLQFVQPKKKKRRKKVQETHLRIQATGNHLDLYRFLALLRRHLLYSNDPYTFTLQEKVVDMEIVLPLFTTQELISVKDSNEKETR